MKAASVYGFEYLCETQLNEKQIAGIQSCDKDAKDVINSIPLANRSDPDQLPR